MSLSTVLLIEDEPSLRQMITALLQTRGFLVDAVEGGAAAIQRLAVNHYSAILLDLMMPDVNGLEVLRYIRLWKPLWLARVIVMTAVSVSMIDRIEEREALAGVVRKPFDSGELARQVVDCVTASRLMDGPPTEWRA